MNITLHILLGSGRLKPFAKQIKEVVDKTIDKISNKVSITDVDVVIYDNPYEAISEIGVGGWYVPDSHLVLISLNPDFPKFEDTIKKELKRTLTHELHHVLRWENLGDDKTLLEALITEGLADHFDVEINNTNPEFWCVVLNDEQLKTLLAKAQEEFSNNNYDHNSWFFGSTEKNIPRWTGYSLGYKLVNDYFQKHPDKKPSNVYTLKAGEFLK